VQLFLPEWTKKYFSSMCNDGFFICQKYKKISIKTLFRVFFSRIRKKKLKYLKKMHIKWLIYL